jgi:hypothetical protein
MRLTKRIGQATTVALVTAVAAAPPAPAAGDEGVVLRRDGTKAVPVVVPEPVGAADGFDWDDAGLGAGAAAATLLVAAAGAQFARRRHVTRRSPLSAAGS